MSNNSFESKASCSGQILQSIAKQCIALIDVDGGGSGSLQSIAKQCINLTDANTGDSKSSQGITKQCICHIGTDGRNSEKEIEHENPSTCTCVEIENAIARASESVPTHGNSSSNSRNPRKVARWYRRWSWDEDTKLIDLVQQGLGFSDVAKQFDGRGKVECMDHYNGIYNSRYEHIKERRRHWEEVRRNEGKEKRNQPAEVKS
jgi:hypothetical protein